MFETYRNQSSELVEVQGKYLQIKIVTFLTLFNRRLHVMNIYFCKLTVQTCFSFSLSSIDLF